MYIRLPLFLALLFAAICFSTSYAQDAFQLNGNASDMGGGCYKLTGEGNNQVGTIWYLDKINLSQPFDVIMTVMLGCKDADGADGIVFGFQPISTSVGSVGGGIGFSGISPSIGVEMDTWQNTDNNDPAFDHMAILKNGVMSHGNNLAGPVACKANQQNVEDCQPHDFRVSWNPNTHTLLGYFDCEERLKLENYDIVNEVFGGNPLVYWGFTASTGGMNNRQEICFKYTSFLNTMPDQFLCVDSSAVFHAPQAESYLWSPTTGLSDPTSQTPTASPTETTLYTIQMTDECGLSFFDTVSVFVGGFPVDISLPPDTSLCVNEILYLNVQHDDAQTYLWNTGEVTPDLTIQTSGIYTVTATSVFCPTVTDITVYYDTPLVLDLGSDTIICTSVPLVLTAYFANPTMFTWQDGSTSPILSVNTPGTYSLQANNACGTYFDNVNIEVEDCQKVFIPNVFTPNADGINDYFGIGFASNIEQINFLRIYDRWGTLLFSRENYLPAEPAFEWDGTYRGKKITPDTFVWVAEIRFRDGTTTIRKGDVTLME